MLKSETLLSVVMISKTGNLLPSREKTPDSVKKFLDPDRSMKCPMGISLIDRHPSLRMSQSQGLWISGNTFVLGKISQSNEFWTQPWGWTHFCDAHRGQVLFSLLLRWLSLLTATAPDSSSLAKAYVYRTGWINPSSCHWKSPGKPPVQGLRISLVFTWFRIYGRW